MNEETLEDKKIEIPKGIDDVLIYGWTDLTTNQKIAIGQMQETIHSLERRIRSFERYEKKQEGKVEALERVVDILIDRMLKAVDLTGRL